ncbi:MAG TPA: CHAT domain-containing protein [Bacteroidetes bacterium]|nr:CHAT domain-containing protein [Bacteroidota bacterium]
MKRQPLIFAIFLFFLSPSATRSQKPDATFWEQKISALGEAGQWDSLDLAYRSYLSSLRQKDDFTGWLYACWDWQSWYFDQTAKALGILNRAVREVWRQPRLAEEAEAMLWVQINRGYHYFQLGNVIGSVNAYEQALKWYRQSPPEDFEAPDYLFLPLGAHYTRLGDNEKARTLYELAISSFAGGTTDGALAGVYNNLGLTWWNEGNYARAIEIYRTGLACRGLPIEKSGLLHLSMAQAFFDDGQTDSTAVHLERAFGFLNRATASNTVKDYRSGAWLLKGRLLARAGKFTEGEKAINKALSLEMEALGTTRHRAVGKIHVALGQLFLVKNKPTGALIAFNNALSNLLPVFDQSNLKALPKDSELYEENTLLEALQGKAGAALQLFFISKDSSWLHFALRCHHLAGKVDRQLRMIFQYQSSKLSHQQKSRQRFEKAVQTAYELWKLDSNEQFVWEGWYFAEQAKAMVLLEGILQQRYRLGPEQAAVMAKRKQLAWYEKQLLLHPQAAQRSTWLADRQQLLDELAVVQKNQPEWLEVLQQFHQLSPERIREIVGTGKPPCIVEFFVGNNSISVFSFNTLPKWTVLRNKNTLEEAVNQLLKWLPSRPALEDNRQLFCQYGYLLYRQLIEPACSGLSAGQPMLIIPDGRLSFLPFEVLLTQQSDASWHNTPFLIRSHPLRYSYSLFVLNSQEKLPGKAPENLLQVAPVFENGERNLTPLLNSRKEVPGRFFCRSKHLATRSATFEKFASVAGQYKILHLSTHAGIDSSGALPHIEFYDRSAWLPDIYALPLHAELVVLSACQTGLGQLLEGEGVMSLSRAFTRAGAKGLVASQWTINEATTATILKNMYRHLCQGQPKFLALHNAKLAWLTSQDIPPIQKSPYYWAALVYIGDGSKVTFHRCIYWWIGGGVLALLLILATVKMRNQRRTEFATPKRVNRYPF